jgi:hypothetical protein
MLHPAHFRPLPLPGSWPRRVRSAAVYAISVADLAFTRALSWAADSLNPRLRLQAELERLRREISLLHEEIRIKDLRMEQIEPHRRPYYPPTARLAILELRAARGWSLAQTARTFLVSPLTIASWTGRLEEEGTDSLLRLPVPVNKFPDFRWLSGQAPEDPLPETGQGEDRPGSCPGRSPPRADHGPADAAQAATTSASPCSPGGASRRYCPPPEPHLARGSDDRAHSPGVLDPLASIRQAPGVAVLLVGRFAGGSFLSESDGLCGLSWGAFIGGSARVSGGSAEQIWSATSVPHFRSRHSVHFKRIPPLVPGPRNLASLGSARQVRESRRNRTLRPDS